MPVIDAVPFIRAAHVERGNQAVTELLENVTKTISDYFNQNESLAHTRSIPEDPSQNLQSVKAVIGDLLAFSQRSLFRLDSENGGHLFLSATLCQLVTRADELLNGSTITMVTVDEAGRTQNLKSPQSPVDLKDPVAAHALQQVLSAINEEAISYLDGQLSF